MALDGDARISAYRVPPGEILWISAVLLFALLHMSVGLLQGLEWTDEGQILYPSWRVARGAVPYRDFHHIYGPLLFMFNGALLEWFGPDIWVIRVALLMVKAAVAALTYLVARAAADRTRAVAAALVVVCVWGTPGYFNVPYANHYALAIVLIGLAAFCALSSRLLLGCALVGACCAVAGLFKQTTGLFVLLGVGLHLLWRRDDAPVPRFPGGDAGARALRLAFLIGTLALCIEYLRPTNTLGNLLWIFAPAGLVMTLLLVREVRGAPTAPQSGAWGVLALCAAAAVPPLACLAWFRWHDALDDLLFSILTGLPTLMRAFLPLPTPPPSIVAMLVLIVAAGWLSRQQAQMAADAPLRRVAAAAAAVLAAVAGAMLGASLAQPDWHIEILWIVMLLPFLAVWSTLPAVFPELVVWRRRAAAGEVSAPMGLFFCVAVMALLTLYPYCDFFHVFMSLPLFLLLIAAGVTRWSAGTLAPASRRRRHRRDAGATSSAAADRGARSTALTAIVTALLCAPFVYLTVQMLAAPSAPGTFARASGVRSELETFAETAELIGYLEALPQDQTLLVLNNKPLLYFLSGRDSPLPRHEFLLYMMAYGAIRDEDAHAQLPEATIIERLTALPPVIVDDRQGGAAWFRRVYPDAARFIDRHYRTARVIGRYRVLGWRG